MKFYKSENIYKKYKTRQNGWRGIFGLFKAKKRTVYVRSAQSIANYYNKKHRPIYKKIYSIGFFLVIFLLLWAGLLLYLPFFKITNVQINGLSIISITEATDELNNYWTKLNKFGANNNYFLTNTGNIAANFKNNFPIQDIKVVKIFPNTLKINISEKSSTIIYFNGNNYYLLSSTGEVIKQLNVPLNNANINAGSTQNPTTTKAIPNYNYIILTYGKNYPIIYYSNTSTAIIASSSNYLTPQIISGIINLTQDLKKEGSGLVMNYLEIENTNTGAKLYSNQPYQIYFDVSNYTSQQITNYKLILAKNKPKYYLDLRYGDRIFWR